MTRRSMTRRSMTRRNKQAITLLRGARKAIEARHDRFVCCALYTAQNAAAARVDQEDVWHELNEVRYRLRGLIQRAIDGVNNTVKGWLARQGIAGCDLEDVDRLLAYRLAWIDEMIAQIKCGAINIDEEEFGQ